MDGSVRISKADRKRYLAVVKSDQRVTRAMILLLLAEGVTWATIVSALATSSATISRAKTGHVKGGAGQVLAARSAGGLWRVCWSVPQMDRSEVYAGYVWVPANGVDVRVALEAAAVDDGDEVES